MQLIEMELKAFELENNSSEVGEKVEESNSTRGSLPISKVTTYRTNDLVDFVSSQAPPDGTSALGLLAFTPVTDSSVPTMSSNITNDSFANGSLPVPMLPAQPSTGFVSLSPGVCFWFCSFVTWCLLVVASHLLELTHRWFSFRHLIAMQRKFRRNIIFPLFRILCHLISTITTQVMQTYGDWLLQLRSSHLLSVVKMETFFLM